MALKMKQLREESIERLEELLTETKERRFKYKMRIASGESANSHEAREMRVDIARVWTMLRAVEIVAERTGSDRASARSSLEGNGWDIKRAVSAARREAVASPAGAAGTASSQQGPADEADMSTSPGEAQGA